MVEGEAPIWPAPAQRYLLGRQPPGHVAPDQPHRVLEPGLVPVDADPGLAQLGVRERLRPGRRVLAAPPPRAAAVAQVPAPVAAARPRQQLGARVLRRVPDPLALAATWTRCGCGPPRRPPSRASGPGRGPSACTTCPCPGRSVWRRARPCPACGSAPAASFPASFFLSLGRYLGPRLRRNSRTHPDMSG